ncbi:MAG TPA: hypothetical protein VJQ54_12160 [Candidatus Sulfotelmatobacter sp.]|nr:hypothetical protein [Candidatus Sulfotelmatobacter sp.]
MTRLFTGQFSAPHHALAKRTVSATCKMSEENYRLAKAADAIWPEAVLTQSGVLIDLAWIGAETVLKDGRKK